jgi:hypothetical protein
VRAVVPLALRVEMHAREDLVQLEIANHSGRNLTDCWFIVAGKSFFLGNIPARANLLREFPRTDREGALKRTLGDISFVDPLRDFLFRHVFFSDQARPRELSDGAVFFGWMQDGRISPLNYTLFRASFPLPHEEEL